MPKSEKTGGAGPNRMMLRRALFLLAVCGIVAFIVLAVQLFRLQILRHQDLESAALEQQMRQTSLTAGRGTIYDRNGDILAMSATTYTVYLSPAEISMYGEDVQVIAQNLAQLLGGDYDKILAMAQDRKTGTKRMPEKSTRSGKRGPQSLKTSMISEGSRWSRTQNGITPTPPWRPT